MTGTHNSSRHDDGNTSSFGQTCRLALDLAYVIVRRLAVVRLLFRTMANHDTRTVTKRLLDDSLSCFTMTLKLLFEVPEYASERVFEETLGAKLKEHVARSNSSKQKGPMTEIDIDRVNWRYVAAEVRYDDYKRRREFGL